MKQELVNDVIDAINNVAISNGLVNAKTITGTTGRITVVHGDGVGGNPTIDLASGIVSPFTYKSVTVDAYGRVTGGTNPTSLAGFGITDAQPLDSDLTALAALSTNGIIARTATGAAAIRTITGSAGNILVTNGDGVSGNPTINLVSGVATPGTYKSVTIDTYGRATGGTNPTTLAGYGITDAQPINSELTALAALATNGLLTKNGSGTAVTRTIAAASGSLLTVANGDGVSGNPTLDITLTSGWVIRGNGANIATKYRDVKNEIATTVDGAKLTYNTAHPITAGTETVFVGGVLQALTTNYSIVGGNILLVAANTTDKVIQVSYLSVS
jgi:phage-related tail fiber protein